MKHTIVMTKLQAAAWSGSMARVAEARKVLAEVAADAESIASEIIEAHGAPAPNLHGGVMTSAVVEGRAAFVYDAADAAPASPEALPVNRLPEEATTPATAEPAAPTAPPEA